MPVRRNASLNPYTSPCAEASSVPASTPTANFLGHLGLVLGVIPGVSIVLVAGLIAAKLAPSPPWSTDVPPGKWLAWAFICGPLGLTSTLAAVCYVRHTYLVLGIVLGLLNSIGAYLLWCGQ